MISTPLPAQSYFFELKSRKELGPARLTNDGDILTKLSSINNDELGSAKRPVAQWNGACRAIFSLRGALLH